MREKRKCPFCGKEMICVNAQDGEFTCTTCAEYANHDVLDFIEKLQAENEWLKGEKENLMRVLKQTEVQDQVVIDGLRNENERLKNELQQSATNCNKLKCLALHGMSEYFLLRSIQYVDVNNLGKALRFMNVSVKYDKSYRKAKKKLKEGK